MSSRIQVMDYPVHVPHSPPSSVFTHRLATVLWSCPPGLQVSGRNDYPQVLDTSQIWALSSVSVGHPSKPCYRIGAHQLAQLAFGKPPGVSHGTSFVLMVPDKPADQSCLPSQGVSWLQDGRETKTELLHKSTHTYMGRDTGCWLRERADPTIISVQPSKKAHFHASVLFLIWLFVSVWIEAQADGCTWHMKTMQSSESWYAD